MYVNIVWLIAIVLVNLSLVFLLIYLIYLLTLAEQQAMKHVADADFWEDRFRALQRKFSVRPSDKS